MSNDSLKNIDIIFDDEQRFETDSGFHSQLGLGLTLPGGKSELKVDGSGTQLKHDGILVSPTPGFVVKTRRDTQSLKIFINVCYHSCISPSSMKKRIDSEGKEIEGMNLPISVGPIRSCLDKDGKPSIAMDSIVNPEVKEKIEADSSGSMRNFVIQVLLDYVEKKYQSLAPIDRRYKLPRLCYKGYVDSRTGETTEKGSKFAEIAKQFIRDTSKQPSIEEVTSSKLTTGRQKQQNENGASNLKIKKESMDSFNVPINMKLVLSNGSSITLEEFLSHINELNSQDKTQPTLNLSLEKGKNSDSYSLVYPLLITILIPSHKNIEHVLPFCASTSSAKGIFKNTTHLLTIDIDVCPKSLIEKSPDVGSHIWTMSRAFSRDNIESDIISSNNVDKKESDDDAYDHHLDTEDKESEISERNDDPYQIKFQFRPCKEDDDVHQEDSGNLPEDRFHEKDVLSRHILAQQENEREKKKQDYEDNTHSQSKKSNASGLQDNVDIEYLDVDDFRPGGKYCIDSKGICVSMAEDMDNKDVIDQARKYLRDNFNENLICDGLWSILV